MGPHLRHKDKLSKDNSCKIKKNISFKCSLFDNTHISLFNNTGIYFKLSVLFIFLFFAGQNIQAQNAIVTENQQTGNPASEWDISGAGDLTIQGFATDISVNKGDRVHFKIKTDASAYSINIYRLGYYQGNGARKVGTGVITATLPQIQPADLVDNTTGLIDCGNWQESAYWDVPATAVSGIYIAKLIRTDTKGASHIVFIVRDDASTSALYFQTSDATWQAYNSYGGNSLYVGNTSFPNGHAAKVSYNRPFLTRNGGGGGGAMEDWLFNAEYPMIRWLERNGYDMTYTTNVDVERRGNLIKNHRVFLSVGHDEYWSGGQRANVEAARNSGVHLAFFSSNEVYWKTRWEPSIDGSNTSYRTLVCYKEGTMGENVCGGKCDPLANVWTGLWRDGCNFPGADGCKPENGLTGQISWYEEPASIGVPSTYKAYRFWRNTNITNLTAGQSVIFPNGTLGYEWDFEQNNGSYPAGRVTMSDNTVSGHNHKLSLYRHSSGAIVFGSGTGQWSWGLDASHDRGGTAIDSRMQQATVNLFADMNVLPGSIQSGLTASTPSNDNTPPVSVITAPPNGGHITPGVSINITGTATESAGVVAGIEVSTDGGVTWSSATGTTSWTFSWTPPANGTYTIKSRAVDDLGNLESTSTTSNTIQVSTNVTGCTPPTATLKAAAADCQGKTVALQLSAATGQAPYTVVVNNQTYTNVVVGQNFATISTEASIWGANGTPQNTNDYDGQSIEVGVKFRSSQNGVITGIRFYKGTANTGTHVGNLYSSTGSLLASATFSNETASGWQEVRFSTPVNITANTTYVASYFSASGRYASSDAFFTNTGVTNGTLTALQNGIDGGNGLYKYGATGFPANSYNGSNYWVDVLFKPSAASYTYTLTSITDNNGCNNTGTVSSVTLNQSDLQSGTQTFYQDNDGDGYGNSAVTTTGCTLPAGYAAQGGDCLDNNASAHPGAAEICGNGIDDNCNGQVDEGCSVTPPPSGGSNDPNNGPGGPVLVITTAGNPFTRYYAEILRAEGLNEFAVKDIAQVTATDLTNYDAVILGEMALSASNVTMLTNWVNAGGTLIAMRPDAQLAGLMGITPVSGTLSDQYLLINTATQQGNGIVGQTIQFHGPASLYTLNGATSLATLYSSAVNATTNPAVTVRDVGTNGGQAIAFAYDLARSVVYTRQGNPDWAGQERDALTPIRSDDQYFGNASFDQKPDYIDLNKVAIPQADEQQHLLANIILVGNQSRKPLPRFWFLPRGLKAAIVMTGDDHASGGTAGRFDQYKALSPSNTLDAVKNWTAIRGTSYLYPFSPLTNAQAQAYQADSFEISLHLLTGCSDWSSATLPGFYTDQLQQFASSYPGVVNPVTHRVHCLVWSEWATEPKVELSKGIRANTTYYYWPGTWLQNRAGMFTGSGMPMRFADVDGSMIDNYQIVTQMTDESDQIYPDFVDSLLDRATGPLGYYGVFCANMHTDFVASPGSDAIINSAINHNVPVISAKQMLTWLDARNSSYFSSFNWTNKTLSFAITAMAGATNIEAMLPMDNGSSGLSSLQFNGAAITWRLETIKGIQYAFFPAATGNYVAVYNGVACTPPTATLKALPGDCDGRTIALQLSAATGQAPYTVVVNNKTYSNAIAGQNFATVPTESSIWGGAGVPANIDLNDGVSIEVGVKFRSTQSGIITGIRFYKGPANTGLHVGNLYSSTGALLASATFSNETASGWQEVRFSTPVSISANTTYVASYYSPSGGYSNTGGYFTTVGATNGTLTALQSGVDGNNGVYNYGPTGMPTSSFNASNYWVDVLFTTGTYTFTLTSVTDNNGCNKTGNISTVTLTQATLNAGTQVFYKDNDNDGYGNSSVTFSGCVAPAGYVNQGGDCNDNNNAVHPGATEICGNGIDDNCDGQVDEGCSVYYRDFDNDGFGDPKNFISAQSAISGYISDKTDCNDSSATVHPGATEICGNGIDDNCNGQIDENCVVTSEQKIWVSTVSPAIPNDYDGQTIEVGVKFRSSQNGTITGIRFFKGTNNTGTHIGNLWTSTGTKLATATFSNETASGWQEVRFTTPVSITANTVYVASYFSSSGKYASTENYFTSAGTTNGALTALKTGVSGGNGVYKYGASGFPTSTYNGTNYWVDVLFKPATASAEAVASSPQTLSLSGQAFAAEAIPNPSSSYFTLTTHSSDKSLLEIRVVDEVGRLVEQRKGIAGNGSIQLGRGYRPGTYSVQVIKGDKVINLKLLKL